MTDQNEQISARVAAIETQRELNTTLVAGAEKYGEPEFNAACNTLASLGANEQPAFKQAVTGLGDSGADVLNYLGNRPEEVLSASAPACW